MEKRNENPFELGLKEMIVTKYNKLPGRNLKGQGKNCKKES